MGILKFRNSAVCCEYHTRKIRTITQLLRYFLRLCVLQHPCSITSFAALSPTIILYIHLRIRWSYDEPARESMEVTMFTYGNNNIYYRHSWKVFRLLDHHLFINLNHHHSVSIFSLHSYYLFYAFFVDSLSPNSLPPHFSIEFTRII